MFRRLWGRLMDWRYGPKLYGVRAKVRRSDYVCLRPERKVLVIVPRCRPEVATAHAVDAGYLVETRDDGGVVRPILLAAEGRLYGAGDRNPDYERPRWFPVSGWARSELESMGFLRVDGYPDRWIPPEPKNPWEYR